MHGYTVNLLSFQGHCSQPVDIAFIVDTSGSIRKEDYQLQKDFIKTVASGNRLSENGTHIGVVLFSHMTSIPIKFNDYYDLEQFKEGVQLMKQEGSITRIDRGLKLAYDQLFTTAFGVRYAIFSLCINFFLNYLVN